MKLFVILDHYLPGEKGGGPPRSLSNMVQRLHEKIDFWIFTSNYDLGDSAPYSSVPTNKWTPFNRANVYYCSPNNLSCRKICSLIIDVDPDAVYLNSFFSRLTIRCLLLRKIGRLPAIPFILQPRGEFSLGCLRIKWPKKLIYLAAARITQLYKNITWQAASEMERQDIARAMGPRANVQVVPNFTVAPAGSAGRSASTKRSGSVRLAFLSRICRKKNLSDALEYMRNLSGEVSLDVFGPIEDKGYWEQCQRIMAGLPKNIRVTYGGTVAQADVVETFSRYHFFLFPTWGENFGHVIFEALAAGCPVITSDQTPWKNLPEEKAGWVFSLTQAQQWRLVLQDCVNMTASDYLVHSAAAHRVASSISHSHTTEDKTLAFFRDAIRPAVAEATPLHCLFLNQYAPPDPSPTARILAELREFLVTTGDTVVIVSQEEKYHARPAGGIKRLLREGRALLAIGRKAMRVRPRPDIVLALSSPPCLLPLACLVALRHRAPLVHWAMDLYPELAFALGELKSRAAYQFVKRLMGWGYRRAKLVIALDEDMAEHLRKSYSISPSVLAPWPAKLIGGSPQRSPSAARSGLPADKLEPSAPWTWLYSGNLGRAHEWRPLLDVQYELERRAMPIRLLFEGGGAMWPAAQAHAESLGLLQCVWKGYVTEAESFETLRASNLVIVTQRREARGFLWPSKLARIIPLAKPLLWIGPNDSAIARSIAHRPSTGSFEPESIQMIADWVEQLFREGGDVSSCQSSADVAAIYAQAFVASASLLQGRLREQSRSR